MRAAAVLLVLAAAGPAAAQPLTTATDYLLQMELQAQQELARQRSVALENQLMSLEARLQAEQGLAAVRTQQARPYLPPPPALNLPQPQIDTSKLASIPDDRLAASNRAVREAAQPAR